MFFLEKVVFRYIDSLFIMIVIIITITIIIITISIIIIIDETVDELLLFLKEVICSIILYLIQMFLKL